MVVRTVAATMKGMWKPYVETMTPARIVVMKAPRISGSRRIPDEAAVVPWMAWNQMGN